MILLIYGATGTEVKTFKEISSWEEIVRLVFTKTDYDDDVFVVLDNNNKILYRDIFDTWKEG